MSSVKVMTDISGRVWRSACGLMEIRCGPWQEVLADVETCDAVICDPPYSPRVHDGFVSGNDAWNAPAATKIDEYNAITEKEIFDFVVWAERVAVRWVVLFSDHVTQREWEAAGQMVGLLVFAPVGWVKPNKPRFQGDGPSCCVEWITVMRHRRKLQARDYGSRPGYYMVEHHAANESKRVGSRQPIVGCKSLLGMRALIRDYTKPGDLIVDPFAGSGTTLLAAAIEGRRAIGAEKDSKTFNLAVRRLSAGYTPTLAACVA